MTSRSQRVLWAVLLGGLQTAYAAEHKTITVVGARSFVPYEYCEPYAPDQAKALTTGGALSAGRSGTLPDWPRTT